MNQYGAHAACYIPVSNRFFAGKLFINDIMYIEISYHDIIFVTKDGRVSIRGNSADMNRYSGASADLYRCHSYLIINLKNVKFMEDGNIIFINGDVRHLGKRNFQKAKSAFTVYLSG